MSIEKDSIQFLKQNHLNGGCYYQGIPFTTQETIDIMGHEMIEKLDQRIKKMVKWKMMMYKVKNPMLNGIHPILKFAHFPSQRVIEVTGEKIGTPEEYIKGNRGLFGFLIPEELKKDNFKLLKEMDYYLIETCGYPIPKYFPEYIARKL